MLDEVQIENLSVHVVSSSQLGAKARDTRRAIKLMSGPQVLHYWDGEKRVGTAIQRLIAELSDPAWDFWMLYAPGVTWPAGAGPPAPDWWEHNLWALGESRADRLLEADRFTAKAIELGKSAELAVP